MIYFDTANSSIPAGYIKFGKKHLYFYNKQGKVLNGEVLCVLDFFVREDIQRHGVGLQLFSAMLEVRWTLCIGSVSLCFLNYCLIQELHESPSNLAYDRPSPKLIEFLKKHFQLCNPDFQPNRFVVYDGVLSFLGAKEVRMK